MYKDGGCMDLFFAIVIFVFAFWQIPASMWILGIVGLFLLIKGIMSLARDGCNCFGMVCGSMEHKTGSELIMEKSRPLKSEPSKEEVKEVMRKENKSNKKVMKSKK